MSAISVKPVNANGSGASGSSVSLLTGIGYNAENQISGWLWSDGKARVITYDAHGQISSYHPGEPVGASNKAGVIRTLTRDAAGRITGYSHTNIRDHIAQLQPKDADRLTDYVCTTMAGLSASARQGDLASTPAAAADDGGRRPGLRRMPTPINRDPDAADPLVSGAVPQTHLWPPDKGSQNECRTSS